MRCYGSFGQAIASHNAFRVLAYTSWPTTPRAAECKPQHSLERCIRGMLQAWAALIASSGTCSASTSSQG
jgi:hypothetical protein